MAVGGSITKRPAQSGLTLIEVMITMTILAVGVLSVVGLLASSIATNNRNKQDTTGLYLAQAVLEQMAAKGPYGASFTMADCNPAGATSWTIATTGAANPGAGANLDSSGNIDFTQSYSDLTAAYPNYAMRYITCGANGTQVAFEARWNVRLLNADSTLVTVGVRQRGASATGGNLPFYAPPVTLRTVVGP